MSDFILEAKDVTKVLGHGAAQVHALKDINLSLRGGVLFQCRRACRSPHWLPHGTY